MGRDAAAVVLLLTGSRSSRSSSSSRARHDPNERNGGVLLSRRTHRPSREPDSPEEQKLIEESNAALADAETMMHEIDSALVQVIDTSVRFPSYCAKAFRMAIRVSYSYG